MVYLVSIANCMAAAAAVCAFHSSTCSLTLDDTQIAFMTRAQGKYRMRTMVLLHSALGFFLSLDKCSLLPRHRNKFLGLIVNAQQLRLIVPQDKVSKFQAAAATFLQQQTTSARQAAQLAGLVLSFAPAVALAPLFIRELYHAARGTQASMSGQSVRSYLDDLHSAAAA